MLLTSSSTAMRAWEFLLVEVVVGIGAVTPPGNLLTSSLDPGTAEILAVIKSRSFTTSSAWRGSASSSILECVARTTLFKILISDLHPSLQPSFSAFILFLSSMVWRVSAR